MRLLLYIRLIGMRSFLTILFIAISPILAGGQNLKLVSVGISANAYRGDLSRSLDKWSNVFHLGFKLNANKKLNGNFNLGVGFITGDNLNYEFDNGEVPAPNPNRFFRTPLFMLNYELNYNLLEWKKIKFYISQGIGLLRINPQDQFFNDLQDQPETRAQNETFSNITLLLPTQVGLIYLFKNNFGLSFQVGMINSLTDYLDNIADWGTKKGNDNIFATRFSFHIPIGQNTNTQ